MRNGKFRVTLKPNPLTFRRSILQIVKEQSKTQLTSDPAAYLALKKDFGGPLSSVYFVREKSESGGVETWMGQRAQPLMLRPAASGLHRRVVERSPVNL